MLITLAFNQTRFLVCITKYKYNSTLRTNMQKKSKPIIYWKTILRAEIHLITPIWSNDIIHLKTITLTALRAHILTTIHYFFYLPHWPCSCLVASKKKCFRLRPAGFGHLHLTYGTQQVTDETGSAQHLPSVHTYIHATSCTKHGNLRPEYKIKEKQKYPWHKWFPPAAPEPRFHIICNKNAKKKRLCCCTKQ